VYANMGRIWVTLCALYTRIKPVNPKNPMGMGMGTTMQNPMGIDMGMGMTFENGYGCGYSSTRPMSILRRVIGL